MAVDLSTRTTIPTQEVVTLSATAGKVTMLTIPDDVGMVSFYPRSTAAKLVLGDDVAQVDDVDLGAADYATLPAEMWTLLQVGPNRQSGRQRRTVFFLASATSSQVIEIMIERGANA